MQRLFHANRVVSVLSMVALLLLIAGCGSSKSSSGTSGGTKSSGPTRHGPSNVYESAQNTGDADWVKTLDPATVTDSVSISDIQMVEANLVKQSLPSLKIVPDLASSWSTSSDHKTWTFHIRPNAKFSDGNPVTASDAAWSLARALLPATKSPVASTYLGDIQGADAVSSGKAQTLSGVKVVDPHTLQITLVKPIAYFLGTLSYPTGDVLEKAKLQGKQAGTYLTNTCSANTGAGPFKFVCTSGSGVHSFYPSGHSPYMKLVPNPYYYGPKPKITVMAPFMADLETNWKQYEAGAVDWTGVPTADLPRAQKMQGYGKVAQLETDYITANEKIPPFNNLDCRLAVSYGIDRDTITKKLLVGTEGPLYDVLPPGLLGYFGKVPGVPYYNPTIAKQHLAKCPGHLSNAILTYQKTGADITHEYDAIAYGLKQIGANVALKPLTFNAWLQVVGGSMMSTRNQENITENLWIDDYPDPQDWLDNLLTSKANYNIGGFNNPQYDSLVAQANVEFNPTKRAQLYEQAAKIALNQGAWIGVGYAYGVFVLSPHLHGLVLSPSGIGPQNDDWSQVSIS